MGDVRFLLQGDLRVHVSISLCNEENPLATKYLFLLQKLGQCAARMVERATPAEYLVS